MIEAADRCHLHLESPREFPLGIPFTVQGWVAAHAPIGAVFGGPASSGESLRLVPRPDVLSTFPHWPHAVGFRGTVGAQARSGSRILLTVQIGEESISQTIELPLIAPPPDHLQVRQVGSVWGDRFYPEGRVMLDEIRNAFAQVGHPLESCHRVLDFGCGCGRVLRGWGEVPAPNELWGCDIDAETIDWNRAHLGDVAQFDCNPTLPRSSFPDAFFDAIYSVSVFTHLPEDMQHAWLAELARILRPGGVLLSSFHGESYWSKDPAVASEVAQKGFAYRTGVITEGLPDFYMVAFHTAHYVRDVWAQHGFSLLHHTPNYIGRAHDMAILRRA